jgi:hypothetical protein
MTEWIAVALSVVSSGLAAYSLLRRKRLTLSQLATLACDHGETAESKTLPRWRLAHEAAVRLDERDNGKRDYSDAALRLAVDFEASRRGWRK